MPKLGCAFQQAIKLLAIQSLALDQRLSYTIQTIFVPRQNFTSPVLQIFDDPAHFFIDLLRRLFAVISFHFDRAQEWCGDFATVGEPAEALAHSEASNHLAREFGCFL